MGSKNIWYRKKISVTVLFNILGTVTHCINAIIIINGSIRNLLKLLFASLHLSDDLLTKTNNVVKLN